MNRVVVWAIAAKDMRSIWSNSRLWLGFLLLPILFSAVLPAVFILVVKHMDLGSPQMSEWFGLLKQLPGAGPSLDTLPPEQIRLLAVHLLIDYMLAPLFLLIPVLNAMMTAVHSFVGEKERRTMESLLFAPIRVSELFLGKVIASFVPSYAVTLASFLLCAVIVNSLSYDLAGGLLFPSWKWLVLILWVTPAFTQTAILFSVWVSARTRSFQEAQQLAGLIVLPIIMLLVGQATGLLFLSTAVLAEAGLLLLAVDFLLLYGIARWNNRDLLFERQL